MSVYPHRLAWSRTSDFQFENTGSNPVGGIDMETPNAKWFPLDIMVACSHDVLDAGWSGEAPALVHTQNDAGSNPAPATALGM